jgi:hypothetical protein
MAPLRHSRWPPGGTEGCPGEVNSGLHPPRHPTRHLACQFRVHCRSQFRPHPRRHSTGHLACQFRVHSRGQFRLHSRRHSTAHLAEAQGAKKQRCRSSLNCEAFRWFYGSGTAPDYRFRFRLRFRPIPLPVPPPVSRPIPLPVFRPKPLAVSRLRRARHGASDLSELVPWPSPDRASLGAARVRIYGEAASQGVATLRYEYRSGQVDGLADQRFLVGNGVQTGCTMDPGMGTASR